MIDPRPFPVRYLRVFNNGEEDEQISIPLPSGTGSTLTLSLGEAGALCANLDNALKEAEREPRFRVLK